MLEFLGTIRSHLVSLFMILFKRVWKHGSIGTYSKGDMCFEMRARSSLFCEWNLSSEVRIFIAQPFRALQKTVLTGT